VAGRFPNRLKALIMGMVSVELAELESAVTEVMHLHEDNAPATVRTLGRPRHLPATGV
jgi:hypothetical protein